MVKKQIPAFSRPVFVILRLLERLAQGSRVGQTTAPLVVQVIRP
jgi:hypothetical protein